MVFGFTTKKKKGQPPPEEHVVKPTPSLPDVAGNAGQAIAWPTGLVDEQEMERFKANPTEFGEAIGGDNGTVKSARKISFSSSTRNVPFHRPFRPYASVGAGGQGEEPTSPFSPMTPLSSGHRASTFTARSKRSKAPPTFNVMVVGSKSVGKTSLLRLFLETADISPSATLDQRSTVESFLARSPIPRPTGKITTLPIEILDSPTERLLLTVVDTPGLDFAPGRELVLEQQINSLVREIEGRYNDTMVEESKVIRAREGDRHIHLCIYVIDPSSLAPGTQPDEVSPTPTPTPSPPASPTSSFAPHISAPRKAPELHLSKGDARVLRRLTSKVNVLPILGKIDSLTEEALKEIKEVVRRECEWGVFRTSGDKEETEYSGRRRSRSITRKAKGGGDADTIKSSGRKPPPVETEDIVAPAETPSEELVSPVKRTADDSSDESESEAASPITPQASPLKVIKIRSTRPSLPPDDGTVPVLTRSRSHSRIRRAHSHANESDEEFDLARGRNSILQTSALPLQQQLQQQQDGNGSNRRMSYAASRFYDHAHMLHLLDLAQPPEERAHALSAAQKEVERLVPFGLVNPEPRRVREEPASATEEEALFVRRFRWGTIDVLNPDHCDFVPMRGAIFGSHLKLLKSSTKTLYESYRTEKLLVRKARQMGYQDLDTSQNPTAGLKKSLSQSQKGRSKSMERGGATGGGGSGFVFERGNKGVVSDDWVDVPPLGLNASKTDLSKAKSLDGHGNGHTSGRGGYPGVGTVQS